MSDESKPKYEIGKNPNSLKNLISLKKNDERTRRIGRLGGLKSQQIQKAKREEKKQRQRFKDDIKEALENNIYNTNNDEWMTAQQFLIYKAVALANKTQDGYYILKMVDMFAKYLDENPDNNNSENEIKQENIKKLIDAITDNKK